MNVTALRNRPEPAELSTLRRLIDERAKVEGRSGGLDPNLCLYRFSRPSEFTKQASFGVTLGVVVQGAKRVRVGGELLTVDADRLLVITRELDHQTAAYEASPARPYLGLALCFTPEQVARAVLAVAEAGARPAGPKKPAAAFLLPYDGRVVLGLQRYLEAAEDPVERRVICPLIAEELLIRLLRSEAASAVCRGVTREPDAARILEAMQFIRRNLSRPLSVARVAREVAMSPSHFAHRFSTVAQLSPMKYLRQVRLEQARTMLLGQAARASEVATAVGFESASHFTREFKRRYGSAPAQYVRQLAPR
jgi:AraC-like DNA-binding protein